MEMVREIAELRERLEKFRQAEQWIGLVPTMGYFHEGHLSLIDEARRRSDVVVVSLFINPTQFAPHEDLKEYPRDLERDRRLAEQRGADIIFYPSVEDMYPEPYFTYVVTEKLSSVLCGIARPIHFRGVTTVVAKLFNIVQPDLAVFGRKDAQQAIIIRRMVADLNFPVEIVVAPTVREADGLAMSSRNTYLSKAERAQAPVIYASLEGAQKLVASGECDAHKVIQHVCNRIEAASLARIEYIEIVREADLTPVDQIEPGVFIAVAVWFGKTRLIDNLAFRFEE